MEPPEAYASKSDFSWLDVRTPHEYEAGYVEGSAHIPLQELPSRFEELDKSKPIVVVCQVGQRSGIAAEFLRTKGFDAHNLEGGLERWVQAGYPLAGAVMDGVAETLDR